MKISELLAYHSPVELLRDEHAVVVVEVLVIELGPQGQGAGPQGLPRELPRAGGGKGDVLLVLVIKISLAEPVFLRPIDLFLSAMVFLRVRVPGITEIFPRRLCPAKLRNECRMDILIFQRSQMLSAVGRTSESVDRVFTRISKIVHTRVRSSFFDSL